MRHDSARRAFLNDQVVICLNTDTIADASERVASVGGAATVVVPFRDGLTALGWTIRKSEPSLGVTVDQRVHPDSELLMVLELMSTAKSSQMTIRIEAGEAAVTEGDPILVPA